MTQLFKHIAGPNPAASSARSVTMEFDATSLFLASAVLAITYLTVNRPEPDVHPFILSEQSVPAGVRQRGESAIYRSRLTPHGTRLPVFPDANTRTIVDIFRKGKGRSEAGQGNCLGGKYANGMWRWLSYAETERRILNFGSGLLNFTELKPNTENNMIGIYMRNSPEWIIADLAAAHYSLVTVPLYPAWALDSIRSCIQQTGLTTLVTTERELPGVLSICQECPTLRWIIVANGTPSAENVDRAQRLGVSLETFAALENIGRTNPIELVLPNANTLHTICFTCGTTGNPRGVMLTHRNIVSAMSSLLSIYMPGKGPNQHDIYMSYLPLSHVFEHTLAMAMLSVGGAIATHTGNPRTMSELACEVRPTILPVVPRILNRLREKVELELHQSGKLKQFLFRRAYQAKLRWLREGRVVNNSIWDRLVFDSIRARFGGRVHTIACGAAPISVETLEWARICFGCSVVEGYGQTESCAAISATHPQDYTHPYGDFVGAILPGNEVKLIDVPELNYFASDEPNPRGEICVRGANVTQGYYRLPEETKAIIDADGWLHTGDVGEFLPNGTLKVIDRKKNICKLSQGEYVAPAKIEAVYESCELVSQVYVHVDPKQYYTVAIVVPHKERLIEAAKERGLDTRVSFEELCRNETLTLVVLESMHDKGCERGLSRYEQARKIALSPEAFTIENGLMTPTFKLKRHVLRERFAQEINALYQSASN